MNSIEVFSLNEGLPILTAELMPYNSSAASISNQWQIKFNPEITVQSTLTQELNVISNKPLLGKVDWIVGASYLDTEVDITFSGQLDANRNGVLDGYIPNKNAS